MLELYEEKRINSIRKIHQCELCGRKIPKGFSAHFHKGKQDGEFFKYYTCNTCNELVNKYWKYCVNEWNDNTLDYDILSEYMNDYGCDRVYQFLQKCRNGEIKD